MITKGKAPNPFRAARGFVRVGKTISASSIAQNALDANPLLTKAQRAFDLAGLARQRGDYGLFWRYRRRGLLLQARWYAQVHPTKEISHA